MDTWFYFRYKLIIKAIKQRRCFCIQSTVLFHLQLLFFIKALCIRFIGEIALFINKAKF